MECAEARPLLSHHLDDALTSDSAASLQAHLNGCPTCATLRRTFEEQDRLLAEGWPPVGAPDGFAARVATALPTRPPVLSPATPQHAGLWRTRSRWLVVAAVLAILLTTSAILQPAAWASLGLFLRQVALRESVPPASSSHTLPMSRLSLDEAQQLVPWRIRQPAVLPDGYRLAAVYAGELHAFAVGPTIVLNYQHGEGPQARHLGLTELRAVADVDEPVEPGAARTVPVAAASGLFIDGRWVERDGRPTWERGMLVRLIVEDGDLVFQLQADPRDGWDADRLIEVAASLR